MALKTLQFGNQGDQHVAISPQALIFFFFYDGAIFSHGLIDNHSLRCSYTSPVPTCILSETFITKNLAATNQNPLIYSLLMHYAWIQWGPLIIIRIVQ